MSLCIDPYQGRSHLIVFLLGRRTRDFLLPFLKGRKQIPICLRSARRLTPTKGGVTLLSFIGPQGEGFPSPPACPVRVSPPRVDVNSNGVILNPPWADEESPTNQLPNHITPPAHFSVDNTIKIAIAEKFIKERKLGSKMSYNHNSRTTVCAVL